MVELALVFLVLVTMLYVAFALTFKIRDNIIAQNLAATGGQMVYRQCHYLVLTDIPTCLDGVKNTLQGFAPLVNRNITVLITLYADAKVIADVEKAKPPFSPSYTYPNTGTPTGSQFSAASFTSGAYAPIFQKSGFVGIVEIYVENKFLFNTFGFGRGSSYEVTIN
jgi:hypothetical protein